MKNEDIFNALNYLPDEMIENVATERHGYSEAKVTVAARFLKPALAVASVALVFGISIFAMTRFGIHTADEAAPEASDNLPSDTANELLADKEDFDPQLSDRVDDASSNIHYSSSEDITITEPAASDIVVEGDYIYGTPTANIISYNDGGISLKTRGGEILSHIDLREHSDNARISVGSITLNYSEKNARSMYDLLSLMERSPIITPGSVTESEDTCMATLHFYISKGWSLMADSVHEPIRIEMELLSHGFVKISVKGFSPIYISVGEEVLTEFTNGLEYLVVND